MMSLMGGVQVCRSNSRHMYRGLDVYEFSVKVQEYEKPNLNKDNIDH